MLKVYFIGYGGNSWMAEELRPIIEDDLGMKLITIHEHENADIKWHKDTWYDHLNQADIIICPANYKVQPAKSANRVTQAMSMGKAIVCSPLPSYIDVAKKYPGCFLFADNPEEWREKLKILRDNESFRKEMSNKAKEASKGYSLKVIGEKWLKLFDRIGDSVNKTNGLVDIVIPTYKNLRGLKLCLNSIRECTHVSYKIIIVDNSSDEKVYDYLQQQKDIIYIKKDRLTFAQAINIGIKAGNSKYIMLLNDDVIVSHGWLKKMIEVCTEKTGAIGPLSNCDFGWLHNNSIKIGDIDLLPGKNTYDEIEPIISQIYNYESPYTDMPEQEWIAFYCTLIPRKIIDEVGLLNEEFINSGEDTDLCLRMKKAGYKIIQNYDCFVWHAGAISRKILEQENFNEYHEADEKTKNHLKHLWDNKSVIIYSGPAWEKFDFRNLETTGIGGSEIWLIWLSRKLSELGYRVTVFADCPESGIKDNEVLWLHYTEYNKWIEQHWVDYAILSRTTDPLKYNLRAEKIYVQIHDIWMLSEKTQLFLDKVTRYCTLSEWHKDFVSDYHNIPKERIVIMSNGIDLKLFDEIDVERNPFRFHWSSSWDRGLDNVLYLWPFIKEQIPEAELHCYYGVYNWEQSCKLKKDQKGLEKIAKLKEQIKQKDIYDHGRVNQRNLAEGVSKASLLFYPGWFQETFFIGGIEAQYAGVPVICNRLAGLKTTFKHPQLGDTAIMLGDGSAWWPYTKEGREQFLAEAISILKNKDKWNEWSEKGKKNAERYSWENCALSWQRLFKEA